MGKINSLGNYKLTWTSAEVILSNPPLPPPPIVYCEAEAQRGKGFTRGLSEGQVAELGAEPKGLGFK